MEGNQKLQNRLKIVLDAQEEPRIAFQRWMQAEAIHFHEDVWDEYQKEVYRTVQKYKQRSKDIRQNLFVPRPSSTPLPNIQQFSSWIPSVHTPQSSAKQPENRSGFTPYLHMPTPRNQRPTTSTDFNISSFLSDLGSTPCSSK